MAKPEFQAASAPLESNANWSLVTANGTKDQQQAIPYPRWQILAICKSNLQWPYYTEFLQAQSGAICGCTCACMQITKWYPSQQTGARQCCEQLYWPRWIWSYVYKGDVVRWLFMYTDKTTWDVQYCFAFVITMSCNVSEFVQNKWLDVWLRLKGKRLWIKYKTMPNSNSRTVSFTEGRTAKPSLLPFSRHTRPSVACAVFLLYQHTTMRQWNKHSSQIPETTPQSLILFHELHI